MRPDIGGLLPTFVLDEYEGMEARLVQDLTADERERYVAANAEALRAHLPADLVFANHVVLGGPVAAATGARYAVKAHGSELEYSMRGNEELSRWGRESLAGAEAVFVGSEHIRRVLDEVVGHVDRVHVVPPGVDIDEFVPLPRDEALRDLLAESRADPPNPGNANERLPDEGNAERLEAFLAERRADRPLLRQAPATTRACTCCSRPCASVDARAVVVGFGDYREELERTAPPRTLFTGPLEHRHLREADPARPRRPPCRRSSPRRSAWSRPKQPPPDRSPLVANHSGLAEIAAGLAAEYPDRYRDLTSFTTGDPADLAEKLRRLLALDARRASATPGGRAARGRRALELGRRRAAATRAV